MRDFKIKDNWITILIVAIFIMVAFVPNFPNFARYKVENLFGKFDPFIAIEEISLAQGQDAVDFYLDFEVDENFRYDELSNTYIVPLPTSYINNKEDLYMVLHGMVNGYGKVILLQDNEVKNNHVNLNYGDNSFWSDYYAFHNYNAAWDEKSIQLNKVHEYTLIFGKETESVRIKFVNENSI